MSFVLLLYTCTMGFLIKVPTPEGPSMFQGIRNMFFHVPMWFAMMIVLTVSVVYAIRYLRKPNPIDDFYSHEFARTGCVLGVLGLITGAIWANFQWNTPWNNDPKQVGAAIALLIYLAYFVLRGSLTDDEKQARIGAVYNIFAFFMLFPSIWILPRLAESLHPGGQGSEGNPGFNPKHSSASIKLVFWPAVIGWTLLAVWISTLRVRVSIIKDKYLNQ